ncbi:glutamate--tRNA ligase family protein, partial [uncultured Peptoniphilus sp.]
VLNKNRKKLSKRQGDVSVEDFKNRGYLPEGIINYLALVGWSPEDGEEIMNLKELTKKFSFERVGKSGGIFDTDKLNWVNSHYIKEYPITKLAELSIPFVTKSRLLSEEQIKNNYEWYKILIETVSESIDKLEDIPDHIKFLFGDIEITEDSAKEELKQPHVPDLLKSFIEVCEGHDEIDLEVSMGLMKEVQKASGVKGKALYMPVRAAISGNVHGPEMSYIIYLLGKEKLISRASKVLESL